MLVRRAVHALRRRRPAAARHALHAAVPIIVLFWCLVSDAWARSPGCRTLPSTPSTRTGTADFWSAPRPSIPGGLWRRGSSRSFARRSFIRCLPISDRSGTCRAVWLTPITRPQGSRGRIPPCPAGHRAEPATPGRAAPVARRFQRPVNIVHVRGRTDSVVACPRVPAAAHFRSDRFGRIRAASAGRSRPVRGGRTARLRGSGRTSR